MTAQWGGLDGDAESLHPLWRPFRQICRVANMPGAAAVGFGTTVDGFGTKVDGLLFGVRVQGLG